MAVIEQDDPCARAKQLKAIRDQIITGQQVEQTEFEAGNGVRRRVQFGRFNLAALNAEIATAEAACLVKQGKRPRRFAVMPR
jgi:hypothetical protein